MKGPGNRYDLLQRFRNVPMVLQVPLDGSHVETSRRNLFFRRSEKAYQGHELPYQTTGPLQKGIDFGASHLSGWV